MRIKTEKSSTGLLFRVFNKQYDETAYLNIGIQGLCADIEFPSDWHEEKRAWVRLGFGVFRLAFSFPWSRTVPDEGQCSGPTYGFLFLADGLHLHWGKCKGGRDDPMAIIRMPWSWRFLSEQKLTGWEEYPYRYTLRSGEIQDRKATIRGERALWWRPWPPFFRVDRGIDVKFSGEVGERAGSWKGGTIGCGYPMKRGESPVDALRRMERERVFS